MTSSIWSMSSMSNQAVEPEIVASSVPKPERMMDGFPWVSAIILYTLSWGWSLIRPNTLYCEDWACKQWTLTTNECNPSWWGFTPLVSVVRVIPKIHITVVTFILFFLAGIFLFGILKQFKQLNLWSQHAAVLLFLVIPVNHARISGAVFFYSFCNFLFFLGWVMIMRSNKIWICTLALLAIFLSFFFDLFCF